MAPLTPHWKQPSHPDIQDVVVSNADFMTESISKISVPPFGLFAKFEFPPCDVADKATYATVQMGKNSHLNLNSDLVYINHSCEPSLFFDMGNMNIVAGPKGLHPGDELTFFYPSTEWDMAQPFNCLCGKPTCKKVISGAKDMHPQQLEGLWLNGHIHELLEEQASGKNINGGDPTAQALKTALEYAEKATEAARAALHKYGATTAPHAANGHGKKGFNGVDMAEKRELGNGSGLMRRGVTSREMSGEMSGDPIRS